MVRSSMSLLFSSACPPSTLTLTLLLFLTSFESISCAKLMKPPPLSFDLLNIKTPQLIGILFGCLVFILTISTVITLLFKSGTMTRFQQEIKSGKEIKFSKDQLLPSPQLVDLPELHDHLIQAKKALPLRLIPQNLSGKYIQIQLLNQNNLSELYEVGNGSAKFDESAYDPERLWGWFPNFIHEKPYESLQILQECLLTSQPINESHLVILDPKIQRIIGMVSLTKNDPSNLTVQIDNLWLTPAYQGKKYSHEVILVLSQWLMEQGYRRISVEIDSRHLIGRKFIERCQWKHEGILRKHRIVSNRNRDTVLYSMLNTDWIPASIALKKHIGLDWKPKTVKIADIQSGKDAVPTPAPATKASVSAAATKASISAEISPSHSPGTSATISSKKPPKKKSKITKKREKEDREKEDSSSDDEDEDELLVPMISKSQPTKQMKKDGVRRTDNISHAFVSSVEAPSAHDNSHPLDLSDPNLYVDDHAPIPLAAIDWQPVEKRLKKRK